MSGALLRRQITITLTCFVAVHHLVPRGVGVEETLREGIHVPGEGRARQQGEQGRHHVDDQEDHVGPLQADRGGPGVVLHHRDGGQFPSTVVNSLLQSTLYRSEQCVLCSTLIDYFLKMLNI